MRFRGLRLAAAFLLPMLLAACGSSQLAMPYSPANPPRPVANARPVVAVGAVVDDRRGGREDANWIGTIRGGYGNPIKRLEAPTPVRDVVAQAFRDALGARGLLAASGGGYELRVTIAEFDATQYMRREATAEFRASLVQQPSGRVVWTSQGRSHVVEGGLTLATGIFGDVEELRRTALRAMSEAIDGMLDRPDFAAAIR
ncbi:YajG family lipoprotein [Muricoccus pecuniae]|uniref:Lipoprotein n=1 Tax=Muricoccus pecuniae TaxID=693023 RepID=A0A840YK32_9PROT|nr:SHOCT domain-containing protein [Roseomonas pecuniae]MBB5695192.1 hypothetical protein [Roseomonas pecuniae]